MVYFVIALSLLTGLYAFDYHRRCLLFEGKCVPHCPRNMHAYHTRCDGQTMSQRTCESPMVYVIGYTCGWSRCDCNGDLLLEEQIGLCVTDKECFLRPSKISKAAVTERRRTGRGRYHLSKRIKITEDELTEVA